MSDKGHCFSCKLELNAKQILDNCTVCFPNQKWLWFFCPACNKQSMVALEKGKISLGYLEGAPGPGFIADCQIPVKNFSFSSRYGGITCQLGDDKYHFKARK